MAARSSYYQDLRGDEVFEFDSHRLKSSPEKCPEIFCDDFVIYGEIVTIHFFTLWEETRIRAASRNLIFHLSNLKPTNATRE